MLAAVQNQPNTFESMPYKGSDVSKLARMLQKSASIVPFALRQLKPPYPFHALSNPTLLQKRSLLLLSSSLLGHYSLLTIPLLHSPLKSLCIHAHNGLHAYTQRSQRTVLFVTGQCACAFTPIVDSPPEHLDGKINPAFALPFDVVCCFIDTSFSQSHTAALGTTDS